MGGGKRRGGNEIACRIPYGPNCSTGIEEVYEYWLLRPLRYSYSVEVSHANICEAICSSASSCRGLLSSILKAETLSHNPETLAKRN